MHLLPLLAIAAAFWGHTPACGTPTVTAADLPSGDGFEVVGLADPVLCRIEVDPWAFRGPGYACMVVLHEYGHLLGYDHSADPRNVMYPVIEKAFWPCAW